MKNGDFTIFPAIHLRDGEVVRFTQGDINNPVVFHTDPLACAQQWIDQGAEWLQVINLDAAFDQETSNNWALIEEIARLDVNIQFGGGIRSIDDVHWAMKSGIKRVIIGTAAVESPQLMADAIVYYGSDAIILAIDADQQGEVKIHGWQSGASIKATGLAIQMRQLGVTHAIHTSIHLDGSMTGVDLQASIELSQISGLNISVGGGIGNLGDIMECYNNGGIEGVIVGKALYTGKVQLGQALRRLHQHDSFDAGLERWKSDQNTPWKRFAYQLVENNLKQHISVDSPPLTILDAGGGNGLDSLALARMNHRVHIVDHSEQMLSEANTNAALAGVSARIKTHAIDILAISRKFENSSFDVVLCHNVIQFMDDLEPLLETLYKVIRPGGFLSLITLNQNAQLYHAAYQQHDLDAAYRGLSDSLQNNSIFDVDMHAYQADELIQWLELQGYTFEKHYGIGCLYAYWMNQGISDHSTQFEKLKK
ncbi:MAG: methyltransferase domain-containing protein, partial [Gammaproteobacteria bacterium]|nr:methyltransferase domain-containing protein [Gammaproteobacteria bacterium]